MMLYHISRYPPEKDGWSIFEPWIPAFTIKGEDKKMPRICFAETPEQCVQAAGLDVEEGDELTMYQVDDSMLDASLLIPPERLYPDIVPDALENMEWWYLGSLKMYGSAFKITKIEKQTTFAWSRIKPELMQSAFNDFCSAFGMKKDLKIMQTRDVHEQFRMIKELIGREKPEMLDYFLITFSLYPETMAKKVTHMAFEWIGG